MSYVSATRLGLLLGLALALVGASTALAIPDWRKDGRPGYETRTEAKDLARMFTEPGAPRAGKIYTIMRDPDGGFTPIFHDPPRVGNGS